MYPGPGFRKDTTESSGWLLAHGRTIEQPRERKGDLWRATQRSRRSICTGTISGANAPVDGRKKVSICASASRRVGQRRRFSRLHGQYLLDDKDAVGDSERGPIRDLP
jgi:hypothetical protein